MTASLRVEKADGSSIFAVTAAPNGSAVSTNSKGRGRTRADYDTARAHGGVQVGTTNIAIAVPNGNVQGVSPSTTQEGTPSRGQTGRH